MASLNLHMLQEVELGQELRKFDSCILTFMIYWFLFSERVHNPFAALRSHAMVQRGVLMSKRVSSFRGPKFCSQHTHWAALSCPELQLQGTPHTQQTLTQTQIHRQTHTHTCACVHPHKYLKGSCRPSHYQMFTLLLTINKLLRIYHKRSHSRREKPTWIKISLYRNFKNDPE